MAKDYGYFGSGSTGYAHYQQTFKSCFGSGSGGGHKPTPPNNNGNNSGCTGCLIEIAIGGALIFLIYLISLL